MKLSPTSCLANRLQKFGRGNGKETFPFVIMVFTRKVPALLLLPVLLLASAASARGETKDAATSLFEQISLRLNEASPHQQKVRPNSWFGNEPEDVEVATLKFDSATRCAAGIEDEL